MRLANTILTVGVFALALLVGLACSEDVVDSGSCGTSADCVDGQACNQGECVDAACLSSSDCDIDQFCSPIYECQDGCEADSDCVAGETCNADSHECESYGCRSTNLDCELGQYCDVTTGECYDSNERHCRTCTEDQFYYTPPNDGLCLLGEDQGSCTIDIFLSTSGCGGGDICFPDDVDAFLSAQASWDTRPQPGTCYTSYNYLYCDETEEEPCPRGFTCSPVAYTDGSVSEPMCLADCDYMLENGL